MNVLKPRRVAVPDTDYLEVTGRDRIQERYAKYLQDESRLQGETTVTAIHFPATTEQVAAALDAARSRGHHVTVSGARTGIVGGAVPLGAEEIISLERLKSRPVLRLDDDGDWVARVAAAVTVDELGRALDTGQFDCEGNRPAAPLFYPVDTTERSAHLGGTIATNASGARTLHYGPTRDWVKWIRVVTPDARLLELRRGQVRAERGTLDYIREDGSSLSLEIPDLPIPPTKNTLGYPLRADMDAVDLFVGSEGTLGIITEGELRLIPKPQNRLFLTVFPDDETMVVDLAAACKRHPRLGALALEYIGPRAIALLRERGSESGVGSDVARLPQAARAALYAEFVFEGEEGLDTLYADLRQVFGSVGLSEQNTWAGFTERTMDEMKRLRHAVPETVNTIIGQRKRSVPQIHKVGTDMAVPDESVASMLRLYRSELEARRLKFVVFGHIGSGHLHVNILPESVKQLEEALLVYQRFAREAVRLGGSVASEHGIGRIKRTFLKLQYTAPQIEAMREIRRAIDPAGTLNPGVLLEGNGT